MEKNGKPAEDVLKTIENAAAEHVDSREKANRDAPHLGKKSLTIRVHTLDSQGEERACISGEKQQIPSTK